MRGFTLIELMVATTILSIIITVGIPSLSNLLDNHQSSRSVNQLRQVFSSARAIALDKRKKITVCPLLQNTCTPDWQNPLGVFLDTDGNQAVDDGETLFLTASNESNSGGWRARSNTMTRVIFNEEGHAFGYATTFLYCPTSGEHQFARQLVINFQGRIRSNYYLSSRGTPYASLGQFNCPQ